MNKIWVTPCGMVHYRKPEQEAVEYAAVEPMPTVSGMGVVADTQEPVSISKELIQELLSLLTSPEIPEVERFQLLHAGLAACAMKFMDETGANNFEISSDFNPKVIGGKYKSVITIERTK